VNFIHSFEGVFPPSLWTTQRRLCSIAHQQKRNAFLPLLGGNNFLPLAHNQPVSPTFVVGSARKPQKLPGFLFFEQHLWSFSNSTACDAYPPASHRLVPNLCGKVYRASGSLRGRQLGPDSKGFTTGRVADTLGVLVWGAFTPFAHASPRVRQSAYQQACSDKETAGMDLPRAKCILETALLCAVEPMTVKALQVLFDDALDAPVIQSLLEDLRRDWSDSGMDLVQTAHGWRFQSKADMQAFLEKLNPEKPPRYSRAVMETLAIIAYKQPVTRGEIEAIRGVTVASTVIKALEERGWIDVVGHKETPGRPALFATTSQFLADLALPSIAALPALGEGESPVAAFEKQNVIPFETGIQAGLEPHAESS
jgi:segregation and condensation protein B